MATLHGESANQSRADPTSSAAEPGEEQEVEGEEEVGEGELGQGCQTDNRR